MSWLALRVNTGAYVIAHCEGSFDFQLILCYFLSDEVLIHLLLMPWLSFQLFLTSQKRKKDSSHTH